MDGTADQPNIHWLSGALDSEPILVNSILPRDDTHTPTFSEGDVFSAQPQNKGVVIASVANEGERGANAGERGANEGEHLALNPFSGEMGHISHDGNLCCSESARKPTHRLIEESLFGCKATCSNPFQRFNMRTKALHFMSFVAIKMKYEESMQQLDDGTLNTSQSFVFPATLADNETYYYSQAMQQPDHADFIKAMVKEVNDMGTLQTFRTWPY